LATLPEINQVRIDVVAAAAADVVSDVVSDNKLH
jgi:hypothetical protein